jgi:hypothetical protein
MAPEPETPKEEPTPPTRPPRLQRAEAVCAPKMRRAEADETCSAAADEAEAEEAGDCGAVVGSGDRPSPPLSSSFDAERGAGRRRLDTYVTKRLSETVDKIRLILVTLRHHRA